MKNFIYLFFTVLIVACSSDDSDNNSSNQTFLERYAGIVWEVNSPEGEFDLGLSFNLEGFKRGTEDSCNEYVWGIQNSTNGQTWNIVENNYDNLIINKETEDGEIDFTSRITVSDDENILTEYISDDEIYTAIRTARTDPCE